MSTFDEREQNFLTPPNTGSGLRIPEHAVRQLVGYGLSQIRKSVDDLHRNIIDQLFARLPATTRADIKTWLRERPNLPVYVNWPREDQHLPIITVVNAGCTESVANTLLGDYGGMAILGDHAESVHRIPDEVTSTIYIAADDPNIVMYLSYLIRFIILSNKNDLTRWYDMHNLIVSMQDVQWDERFFPTFCYMRTVQLQYLTYFDFGIEAELIKLVSVTLAVESTDADGVSVATVVSPGE